MDVWGLCKTRKSGSEALKSFKTFFARDMGVNKLNFTGGELSIYIPYLEAVTSRMKEEISELEVGMVTNGFSTLKTMKRLVKLSLHINFEIKAFDDEIHQAITGAPAKPVLKNVEWLMGKHLEKIRLMRTVVISGINDSQIIKTAQFIRGYKP